MYGDEDSPSQASLAAPLNGFIESYINTLKRLV
jgi:hypothetical protein